MYKIILFTVTIMTLGLSHAIASGPDQSLRVISDSQGGYIDFEASLGSFLKIFKEDSKTTWNNSGDGWILSNESVDPMTDQKTLAKFLLLKKNVKKEDVLDIQRIVINGKDIPQIIFPNTLYPFKEVLKGKGLLDMKKTAKKKK